MDEFMTEPSRSVDVPRCTAQLSVSREFVLDLRGLDTSLQMKLMALGSVIHLEKRSQHGLAAASETRQTGLEFQTA